MLANDNAVQSSSSEIIKNKNRINNSSLNTFPVNTYQHSHGINQQRNILKTYPQTGDKNESYLSSIGFILINVLTFGWFASKRRKQSK